MRLVIDGRLLGTNRLQTRRHPVWGWPGSTYLMRPMHCSGQWVFSRWCMVDAAELRSSFTISRVHYGSRPVGRVPSTSRSVP